MFIVARAFMISEIFLNSYVARKAIRKTEVQFHLQNPYLNSFISKNSCWQSSCLIALQNAHRGKPSHA